jgi:hypothetical protein
MLSIPRAVTAALWRQEMQNQYDVTIITVRPATHLKALSVLEHGLANDPALLACWFSEIGALNQIMILRSISDPAAALENRMATQKSKNPFDVGEFMTGMTMDTFVAFDFLPPMQPGTLGPCFEVRIYILKHGGLAPTIELWRKAVPVRNRISPVLTAMTSVTGAVTRFTHIWPYTSVEERGRLRAKAAEEGVWPPPGGPDHIAAQQVDIFFPAPFSPIR